MPGSITEPPPDRRSVRLLIRGLVQGVWYRSWTVETARSLGLDGWVRNRADGTVEAVVSGPAAAVEAMIAACHEGPPAAEVSGVEVGGGAGTPPPGFIQRPTT